MKNKKAFTLIELVSVLVILAILTLIVTPLVLNIIKKAKNAADRRSVDAYGRSVELAIASYTMDTGQIPTVLDSLEVEYTGKAVVCNIKQLKENGGLYMSQCTVNGKDVKDSSTDDGWYHYGTRDLTNEEYVDMYGDALKEASLAYYEEHNEAVSDYTTLNIDYTGKSVSCDVTINYDGSIYLESCSVDGSLVENHTYGEKSYTVYNIGDEITYKGMEFYVIENSDETNPNVLLLKSELLTYSELQEYSSDKGINVFSVGNYGAMYYLTSNGCSYSNQSVCTSEYNQSDVKYVVDTWANKNIDMNDLVEDLFGYKVRLIRIDELVNNLGYESGIVGTSSGYKPSSVSPTFLRASTNYWTMTPWNDSSIRVWRIISDGRVDTCGCEACHDSNIYNKSASVRPVITLKKSALN